jgi:hypothetical protein
MTQPEPASIRRIAFEPFLGDSIGSAGLGFDRMKGQYTIQKIAQKIACGKSLEPR